MEMLASKCTNGKTLRTNVLVDDMGQLLLFLDEYIRSYEPNGFYEFTRNIFVVLAAILQIPLFEKAFEPQFPLFCQFPVPILRECRNRYFLAELEF
jgi:hypothetical protein